MSEVAVAFPEDEATAQVMASRLRAAGIATRLDRGLHGSWQLPAQGQITVLVDSKTAAQARNILQTRSRRDGGTSLFLRAAVVLLAAALIFVLAVTLAAVLLPR